MKHKYITWQILLACLSKPVVEKSIHDQLEETLAERKRIMQQLERISQQAKVIDMYLNREKAA